MKKRGQITIFVVLGLVILVIVGLIILMTSTPLRKEMPFKLINIEEEVADVREYVTSCLEESLKSAAGHCSGSNPITGDPNCPYYEENIEERVEDYCINNCRDFSVFENLEIEEKGGPAVKATLTPEKKVIVTMEYPLLIKKGETEHMLGTTEPFFAQYYLKQSGCIPIAVDAQCKSTEPGPKTVEVLDITFTFNQGDAVVIGGSCVAC